MEQESDIEGLFRHLADDLGHDLSEEKDWVFAFHSRDTDALEELGDQLEDDFLVEFQESLETIDLDSGEADFGPPVLNVIRRGILTCEQVKQLAQQMGSLAQQFQVQFAGVHCFDPVGADDLLGWLSPAEAIWRLRHMTELGLSQDEQLPWAFLIACPTIQSRKELIQHYDKIPLADPIIFEQPDEQGNLGLCLMVAGRNNESQLEDMISTISQIAEQQDSKLTGLQFFDREMLEELQEEWQSFQDEEE